MLIQILPIAFLMVSTLTNGLSAEERDLANQKRGRYSISYNPVDAYIRRLSMDYLRRIKFALATGGRKANKRSVAAENIWGVWGRDDSPMLSRRELSNEVEEELSPMLSRREMSAMERELSAMLQQRRGLSPMLSKKSSLSKRSVENQQENTADKKSSPMLSKKSNADSAKN